MCANFPRSRRFQKPHERAGGRAGPQAARSPSPPDMTTLVSKMSQAPSQTTTTQVLPTPTPAQVIDGPVTRSRAKKLQQDVHALLCEIHFNINENYILPKCSTLIVLRYIEEKKDELDLEDGLANRTTRVKNGPVQDPKDKLAKRTSRVKNELVQRNIHNVLLTKVIKARDDLLESLSSLVSSPSGCTRIRITFIEI